MTTTFERTATAERPFAVPVVRAKTGPRWFALITTTDHKLIGYMYLVVSFVFFLLAGVMALLIRAELFSPGMQILGTKEEYNQLFTMHGTLMLLLFATPTFAGLANAIMPLQIGAPDVAFPRLNALSFWFFFFGGITATSGFLLPSGPADFGWFAYTPLSTQLGSPGFGPNLWIAGLALSGFGTILGAVNFITTIVTMRAPGMTMWRMPIFTWNTLLTSVLVLMAFPVLAAALFALLADRVLGAPIFRAEDYGPILWQHLFWFFGHPEVYILAEGMPRRYADYLPEDGFTTYNRISTIGSFILGAAMIPFLLNIYVTWKRGERVLVDDPWGTGRSLEWATTCPPPRHDVDHMPRIRSESPAYDLHHPEVAQLNQLSPQDDSAGRTLFGDAERGSDHDTDEFDPSRAMRD